MTITSTITINEYDRAPVIRHRSSVEHEHEHDGSGFNPQSEIRNPKYSLSLLRLKLYNHTLTETPVADRPANLRRQETP
jgi:hypothetical protein